MTAVEPFLADLGALNSHARSTLGVFGGPLARAIYAYKEAATWSLLRAGAATVRPMKWRGPCGKCDGTGLFTFWDIGGRAPCRGCNGTGTATLRFAEVKLPDGQAWHHPWYLARTGFIGRSMAEYVLRGDKGDGWEEKIEWGFPPLRWRPQLPGKAIDGDGLVEALNRVEGWIIETFPGEPDEWRGDAARRVMARYQLNVSHRIPAACWGCGDEVNIATSRIGSSGTWPLCWSAPVCDGCYEGTRKSAEIAWPRDLPAGAMTPAIELWISRRPATRPEPERW